MSASRPSGRPCSTPTHTPTGPAAHFARGVERPWRATFPVRALPPADVRYSDVHRGVLAVDPREHYARLRIPTLVYPTLWMIPEASHGLILRRGDGPPSAAGPSLAAAGPRCYLMVALRL